MKKFTWAVCACAMVMYGCIDRDFNIADVSGEVTIGGEELVLPLAKIEQITLDQLIVENEMVKPDENGVYTIMFSSFGDNPNKFESIAIDGVTIPDITGLSPKLEPITISFQQLPTSLAMSGFNHNFTVDYPTINNDIVKIAPIEIINELDLNLPISGQGAISEQMLSLLQMQGLGVVKYNDASETGFNAEISLLEQINKIDWVEFGCDKHPFGAPFEVKVDLHGLQDVVGGGKVKLYVEFPEGYYLCDENGVDFPVATHNILSREVVLEPKQKKVEFLVHLNRIDYSDHTAVGGVMKVDDHIKYSYDLDLSLCAGTYNLSSKPKISISTAPEYKDVEVVINHFELDKVEYPIHYAFDGMPDGVKVEKVAFKNTYLTFVLKGLEWLEIKDNFTDAPLPAMMKITLPECMSFEQGGAINGSTLSASAHDLSEGVRIKLNHIDCTTNGIKQENGQLLIDSNITAEVDLHNMDGHTVLLSSLTPPTQDLNITVALTDTQLYLDTANTEVTWSEEQSFDLNLGDKTPSISQTIEVPEMIASIDNITIGKAGGNGAPVAIDFAIAKSNNFPVNELELNASINLGKLLRPTQATLESGIITKSDNGDYILAINEVWHPRTEALSKHIEFEALENIPAIVNGKLTLNQSFPITGSVKIKSGEGVELDKLDNAVIDIDVAIDDIEIRTFTGALNLEVAPDPISFELGDMGNLGVDIGALTLNPILKLNLNNPSGVSFFADASLKICDANNKVLSTINVPTIEIAGTGMNRLVISTPKNESAFSQEGVTFISVPELATILQNGFPSKILFDIKAKTDSSKIYTIDLAEVAKGYVLDYQYEVIIPLTFDGELNISYGSSITGLGDVFSNLASWESGITVNDVGLLVEFGTTIPFNIVLTAELINKDGTTDNIEASLDLEECVIAGYTPEDGEKKTSNIAINFNLGESKSFKALKNVDGLRFKFTLYNTEQESASLNSSQFLDGEVKLRVRDGLTVDIFDLLNVDNQ